MSSPTCSEICINYYIIPVGYNEVASEENKVASKKSPPQQNGSYQPTLLQVTGKARQSQLEGKFSAREGSTIENQSGYSSVKLKQPVEPRYLS